MRWRGFFESGMTDDEIKLFWAGLILCFFLLPSIVTALAGIYELLRSMMSWTYPKDLLRELLEVGPLLMMGAVGVVGLVGLIRRRLFGKWTSIAFALLWMCYFVWMFFGPGSSEGPTKQWWGLGKFSQSWIGRVLLHPCFLFCLLLAIPIILLLMVSREYFRTGATKPADTIGTGPEEGSRGDG